ncbi:mechanosensitive ion channel domain-containing protein [Acidovorax sp. CCYZU-2555]|uniref:mechanosensitive ion channel domain-containing protein n=1 Tax=Acidovorax sp. CCYZU-2555 TaxID=2835042 RepID=UPI0020C02713|nr:mechanosensitive ion channel domain-containing protein [Acidovorax sp. CCYZU-2555]
MQSSAPPFRAPRWLAAFCLVMGMVLAGAMARAQAPGAGTPAAAVQPIALQDILARADDDQQRVDRARRLLAAPDPLGPLQASLDAIAAPVDAKLHNVAGAALRELPVMRLESLARHWQFDVRRQERWEADARRAFAPYADSALYLAQRRAAWSATRAQGLLDGLPAALAERVDGMLSGIDAAEAALGVALSRQFALMQQASELKARIDAGGSDVAAAIAEIDRGLLRKDAPALWQGLEKPDAAALSPQLQMDRGLDIERQFAIDYNAADTGNQRALQVVQLLLLPVIVWLVVRSRHVLPVGDGAPVAATLALRRPLSAWLLLSLLAVLAFEADAPLLVQECVLLLALVPALRLLPAGTLRALGAWPYVAVVLYVLDRVGVAVPVDKGWYRLYLLGLNALALGLTVWLLRRTARPPQITAGAGLRLRTTVRAVAWVVLCLLAVAAIANVVGNVSLAETLTSGVIDSGYMALLLYAGVNACLGLLRALFGQPELVHRRLVREHGALVQTAGTRLLLLAAGIGWLIYSMDRFRVLRPLHDASTTVLAFGINAGEVSIHLGDVLTFAFSAWLALWAARAVRRLLRDELPGRAGLPRGAGNSIASLSYYGVLLVGLLIALSAAGFKVSQLTLVFGALGVGIGFGLQNVVNNFVSGLVLMFERPIQPGDVVDVAGISGTVRGIGLRATVIRTFDGADVVVPNGQLLNGNLTNWTMFDRSRRVEVVVGVAYGSDPGRVIALLQAAACETPGVAATPAPVVLMTGYGDNGLNFAVRVWAQDQNDWSALRSALLARMLGALNAAGIAIPYNQLEVTLRSAMPPMEGEIKPGTASGSAPASRASGNSGPR